MKRIPLTQGKFAIVDSIDYLRTMEYNWSVSLRTHTSYAKRAIWDPRTKRSSGQYLHHFISGFSRVNHKNGDGLDNRRKNLLPATHLENAHGHCSKKRFATSKYRGVSWNSDRQKWASHICLNRKDKNLGNFLSEKMAAKAYDLAAKTLGLRCSLQLNFP